MKKISLIVVVLIAACVLTAPGYSPLYSGKKSVVDYYRAIPKNLLKWDKYLLRFKNGQWITRSINGNDFNPTVDTRNGYIKIHDMGTGGGSVIQEVVLFLTSQGKPILGVNQLEETVVHNITTIKFYDVSKGSFKDITVQVLPKIVLEMFLDADFDRAKLKIFEDLRQLLSIRYELPRYGTMAHALPDTERFFSNIEFSDDFTPEQKNVARELKKSIIYKKVELPWDMKKGKFSIGKKLK